jgi:hypothetical protein
MPTLNLLSVTRRTRPHVDGRNGSFLPPRHATRATPLMVVAEVPWVERANYP